jgi:hypothetical protein
MHLLRVIVACKALLLRLKKTFRRKLQAAVSQSRRRFQNPGTELTCSAGNKSTDTDAEGAARWWFRPWSHLHMRPSHSHVSPVCGGRLLSKWHARCREVFCKLSLRLLHRCKPSSCGQINGTEVQQNLKLVVLKYYKPQYSCQLLWGARRKWQRQLWPFVPLHASKEVSNGTIKKVCTGQWPVHTGQWPWTGHCRSLVPAHVFVLESKWSEY